MKYLGPKTDGDDLATQSDVTGGGAELSDAIPDAITPDQAGSAGTSTEAARADHSHAITAGAPSSINATQSNSEGNNTTFARSDHLHQVLVGTPGAIQPDDSASAGSASSLARSDHRHSIAAASAGTITGTNAEGSSTSFARADHDHAFGAGSIPQSALALGPTYETSLPGSPVDGQEIYYAADATNGVIWHLRYRSGGGTYKWECVGGGALTIESPGSASAALTGNTWGNISTAQEITIPLAGEYLCQYTTQTTNFSATQAVYTGLRVNTTEASVGNPTTFQNTAATVWGTHSQNRVITSASANVAVTLRYRPLTNNQTISRYNTSLIVRPIRVG